MISEQDKQAILNGALAVDSSGRKLKYIGKNHHFLAFAVIREDGNMGAILDYNEHLSYRYNAKSRDIVGLWKNKPEPFDLDRALKGECINYSGEPCYIYYSNRKTETHEYIVEASSGAFTLGGVREDELSKCMMWKEPKPQLSSNSLQLPKPLTSPPTEKTYYFISAGVTFADGAYIVVETTWDNDHGDKYRLNCGRIYASREDAIKVIEAITGKPYGDR